MIRFKWCMNPFSVICWYKTPVGVRVEDFTHQLHCCCLQEEMHGFLSISWSCSPLWYSSFETAYKSLCELTSTSSCLPYVSLMLAWFQWLAQGQTVICSENYHHCSWRICSWGQKGHMILMLHITFFFSSVRKRASSLLFQMIHQHLYTFTDLHVTNQELYKTFHCSYLLCVREVTCLQY